MSYRVSVLVDDPEAWIVPWAEALMARTGERHQTVLVHDGAEVAEGDFCFLLGCVRMVPPEVLSRNRHNLVVHESGLPEGRGFSPVAWQVSQGRNVIPVCLLEATAEVDAGPVYLRDYIYLEGTELLPEIRRKQGAKTVELCLRFLAQWPDLEPQPQQGVPTVWRRRHRGDDRIDPHGTIAEQFDHLRIVDNERYPAWFELRGRRYVLQVLALDDSDP